MALAAFDTLKVSKDLQQAGLEKSHAEAIALAVKQGQGDLATKQDIDHLRTELKTDIDHLRTELKTDIDHLRTELKTGIDHLKSDIDHLRTEFKTDNDHLRTELKSDNDHLRTELKSDIDHLRTELKSDNVWFKWVIGVNLALTIGIIAAIISGTITLTLAP